MRSKVPKELSWCNTFSWPQLEVGVLEHFDGPVHEVSSNLDVPDQKN